jgi:hypothetical protein
MLGRSARLLLLVSVLAAAMGAAAGKARAELIPLYDFCKTAAPDRTLVLGAGVPKVEAAVTGFVMYANNPCPRWIVDIVVPTTSSGGAGYFDDFAIAGGIKDTVSSPSWCGGAAESIRVYRKSTPGGDFAYLGGGRTTGTWNPGGGFVAPHCDFVKAPAYVDLPWFGPPSYATAVYRVAVSATMNDGAFHAPVRVRAWHAPYVG